MTPLRSDALPDTEVDTDLVYPEPENPWTPEVLARFGPETPPPF